MIHLKKGAGAVVAAVACGILATAAALAQEPLLNIAPAPTQAPPASRIEYAPVTPPAASDPGVLEAPALIARNLNESDVDYTARMQQKNVELKAETARLMQRHDALMREILAGFGGRKEPRFPSAVPNALPAPPVPAATPAVPAPAERHERGTLLTN